MSTPADQDRSPYVGITEGMRGWFAVLVVWNPDGYWEPENSGVGSYATKDDPDLLREAASWAMSEGVRLNVECR